MFELAGSVVGQPSSHIELERPASPPKLPESLAYGTAVKILGMRSLESALEYERKSPEWYECPVSARGTMMYRRADRGQPCKPCMISSICLSYADIRSSVASRI